MKTPGSPNRVAPATRNCMANSVLPHPGPPHTRVGRPAGNPPPVISSNPEIPVGALSMPFAGAANIEEDWTVSMLQHLQEEGVEMCQGSGKGTLYGKAPPRRQRGVREILT
jgi:hypothetical protein